MALLGRAVLILLLIMLLCIAVDSQSQEQKQQQQQQGSWELLLSNAGIASMHTAVTRFGNVVMLDRTNIGPSQLQLPNGGCRDNTQDLKLQHDCTAHSAVFDPSARSIRPLFIFSDTWCSSGQFTANGTLVQTGGDNEGFTKVRSFSPCPTTEGTCDWVENNQEEMQLQEGRWYSTNQLLPNGSQVVVGGRGMVTLEFIPRSGRPTYLDLLPRSGDEQGDNLYPFVHLLPDGNLFIFANRFSVLYDYRSNTVIRKYPDLPGFPRNYPSAGSSVMLPLTASSSGVYSSADVLVCGGAAPRATFNVSAFLPAAQDCGRITATGTANPSWSIENMPLPRAMGDMVLLPSGEVLIINGAQNGCQGWDAARNPALNPVMYDPNAPSSDQRFSTLAASNISRMYHSTANLLPDGRILISGSNPHELYTFFGDFPTELRLEAFSPPYLDAGNNFLKPRIFSSSSSSSSALLLSYGEEFNLTVSLPSLLSNATTTRMQVNLASAPFVTHSFSQGQRLVKLLVSDQQLLVGNNNSSNSGNNTFLFDYRLTVKAPPTPVITPPSYYMLFVVNQGIPSSAQWIQIS